MRLERIVVGVDFSPTSLDATKWVAQGFEGAELVVVHSVYVPEPPSFLRGRLAPAEIVVETAREGATARLRELSASLGVPRVAIEVRVGRPAEELAAAAREHGADLVVAGKHGEHAGARWRLGSTAERLVHCSPAPVLLATGMGEGRPRHLLVAIDDARTTPRVLDYARFLAQRLDARITALHVVSSAVLSHVLSMAAVSGRDELSPEEIQTEFRLTAGRWIQSLVDAGVEHWRVDSEVAFGDAGQEILAAAERLDADLVVMGSRGVGAVRRALLGSVVSKVLREATRPVLVAIEPEEEIARAITAEEIA